MLLVCHLDGSVIRWYVLVVVGVCRAVGLSSGWVCHKVVCVGGRGGLSCCWFVMRVVLS